MKLARGVRLGLLVALIAAPAAAQDRIGKNSGLALPRFVSLKSGEVKFRRGPGTEYAAIWVLRRRRLPVKVIGEYWDWWRIELHTGERGWVNRGLLSSRRYAMPLEGGAELYVEPSVEARLAARVETTRPLRLRRCSREWCEVEAEPLADGAAPDDQPAAGWALKRQLWGVDSEDVFG